MTRRTCLSGHCPFEAGREVDYLLGRTPAASLAASPRITTRSGPSKYPLVGETATAVIPRQQFTKFTFQQSPRTCCRQAKDRGGKPAADEYTPGSVRRRPGIGHHGRQRQFALIVKSWPGCPVSRSFPFRERAAIRFHVAPRRNCGPPLPAAKKLAGPWCGPIGPRARNKFD